MSENRKSVERFFKVINNITMDDVQDIVADNAVVITTLGLELSMIEWIAYMNKIYPEYRLLDGEINEINEFLFETTYIMSIIDNARKYRSEYVGHSKVQFKGNLITKIEITSDGNALDIGHLIKVNKKIFPDFEL